MNRILLFALVFSGLHLVSCTHETANQETGAARLVETYSVFTGNNRAHYEFSTAGKTVSATVDHYYNHPTGDKSTSGSLATIFEALTGAPPESPNDYQTLESIFPLLEDNGWVVIDDKKQDDPDASGLQSTIRTVNLRRKPAN